MSETKTLQYNEASEIDGPEDVELPKFAHHLKIRSELDKLLQRGLLSADESDELYDEWKELRQ